MRSQPLRGHGDEGPDQMLGGFASVHVGLVAVVDVDAFAERPCSLAERQSNIDEDMPDTGDGLDLGGLEHVGVVEV
jgi:hypothetical protein